MKTALFALIEEKRQAILKLKHEYHILLTVYYSLPSKEEDKEKQKEFYEELMSLLGKNINGLNDDN